MTDIEIPLQSEKTWKYRLMEILPGALTWLILLLPLILSFINPRITVLFILTYLLLWFAKAVGLNIRVIQGWRVMQKHIKLPWAVMLQELDAGKEVSEQVIRPSWHDEHVLRAAAGGYKIKPREIYHAIIVATYNESREVLEPSLEALADSNYDPQKIILILAYEERGGPDIEKQSNQLINDFKSKFGFAAAIKHPKGIAGEVIGKGGNITYAGKWLERFVKKQGIDPINVVVTTLDSDHRPHTNYLAALTYTYCISPDPVRNSFQPIPMFTNNIWDAPAPMRVIATGNSFWMIIQSLRPHILRNFASHAQSLQTLIDTNFWSVRTIVEDGHQFWRTYFRYDGIHEVYPIYVPIYQDAVLASTFWRTVKAQFLQLRRWAWGATDIAYVAHHGFFKKNKVSNINLISKFARLLEGHVSWSTAPPILAFSAFIPALINPQDIGANLLPLIASRIQTVAMVGIFITLYLSFKALPAKPARYKRHRTIFMVLQWGLLPVTTILYNSFAAIYSQTRLMIGKYIDKFDVTEKAVKS